MFAKDRFGYETALNAAIRAGHVDVDSLLLALGASPNADVGANHHAQPVLHTHLRARHLRIDMVRLLLESGADPNGRAFWADGPMLEAGDDGCFRTDSCSHEALFELLFRPTPFGRVYFDVLDLLIAYGFDITHFLTISIHRSDYTTASRLLTPRANLNTDTWYACSSPLAANTMPLFESPKLTSGRQ